MKAMDNFFKKFNSMMDELPNVLDESVKEMESELGSNSDITSVSTINGHVTIIGKIKSLKINGKVINLEGAK